MVESLDSKGQARTDGRPGKVEKKRNPVDWWDDECDQLVRERKRACVAYKKHNCLSTYIEKKRCIALVRKAVRRKKKESFRFFAESLDRFVDMRYVWKRMNVFKNRYNTQRWNPLDEEEYREIAYQEIDKIAPQWAEEPMMVSQGGESSLSSIRDSRWGLNGEFTRAELDRALNSCRDRSSPGPDGIDYKMLKRCPEKYKLILLDCINYSFVNAYLFRDWKEVLTIFIGKA